MKPSPRVLCSSLLTAVAFFTITPSHAALLVYEGFNGYNTGTLTGQTATNTTGLTGNYGQGAGGQILAQTQGLSLSNLSVSGGSAANSSTTPSAVGVKLDTNISFTGTLYSSYLVQLGSSPTSSSSVTVGVNTNSTTSSGSRYFTSSADLSTNSSPGVGYGTSSTSGAPSVLSAGTTYVMVSRYTNVGLSTSVETPGQATLWILTASQFDHFKNGGFSDEELDSAGVGEGSSNVTFRLNSASITDGTTYSFGGAIQFGVTNPTSGAPFAIDEVRFGESLNDVLPIPEPKIGALVLGTFTLAAAMRFVVGSRVK